MNNTVNAAPPEIRDMLETLLASCREGQNGTWDGSPEGFDAMAKGLHDVANRLGLKIREPDEICRYGIDAIPDNIVHYCADTMGNNVPPGIKWSGDLPVPNIGDKVSIRVNRLGEGTVVSYAIEHGWLLLECQLINPPEWHLKQHPPSSNHHRRAIVTGFEVSKKEAE